MLTEHDDAHDLRQAAAAIRAEVRRLESLRRDRPEAYHNALRHLGIGVGALEAAARATEETTV